MTKQLSIKLDGELDSRVRTAAQGGNISEWMAEAARRRLTREMWENYGRTADALGINDPDWMTQELAAIKRAQRGQGEIRQPTAARHFLTPLTVCPRTRRRTSGQLPCLLDPTEAVFRHRDVSGVGGPEGS